MVAIPLPVNSKSLSQYLQGFQVRSLAFVANMNLIRGEKSEHFTVRPAWARRVINDLKSCIAKWCRSGV